jgi:glycosyltransferase involved in cell wall biosynthesis
MVNDLKRLPSISVFFPCYNESANVERVIEDALEHLPGLADDFEVLIIDDGSTDGTSRVVESIVGSHEQVRLISHAKNLGYGRALRTGFQAAIKDLVCYVDGDGQFSLADLSLLLAELPGHGFVLGYRRNRADPIYRRLNGWLWTGIVRFVLGVKVRDVDCGFKLFRREAVHVDRLISGRGAAISAELISRAHRSGHQFTEVGVTHYPRRSGEQSGNSPTVILRSVIDIIRLWRGL